MSRLVALDSDEPQLTEGACEDEVDVCDITCVALYADSNRTKMWTVTLPPGMILDYCFEKHTVRGVTLSNCKPIEIPYEYADEATWVTDKSFLYLEGTENHIQEYCNKISWAIPKLSYLENSLRDVVLLDCLLGSTQSTQCPPSCLDDEMCAIIMASENFTGTEVPKSRITPELALKSVYYRFDDIRDVSEEHRTEEMYMKSLLDVTLGDGVLTLLDVPRRFRTERLCLLAILRHYGRVLYDVPSDELTEKMCEAAVLVNASILEGIPDRFLTEEFYKTALKNNPYCFRHIPKEYVPLDVYKSLLRIDPSLINEFGNEIGVKHAPAFLETNPLCFQYFPEFAKTPQVCRKACRLDGLNLQYVPVDLRTVDICDEAVHNNVEAKRYMPPHFHATRVCRQAASRLMDRWTNRTMNVPMFLIGAAAIAVGLYLTKH